MLKWIIGVIMCTLTSCNTISQHEGKLRLNIPSEPAALDPRKGGDIVSSCMQFMLFEGLTRLNTDSTTSPAQAASIDISTDKTIYTFHIKESAVWTDGTPVTAKDFEMSWKTILNPQFPSPNAHLLYSIKNAEAAKKGEVQLDAVGIQSVDAKTLVVTLERPTPYFLQLTAFCVLFPVKYDLDKENPQWAGNAGKGFISNGPFTLAEWKHNAEMTLLKNTRYWNAGEVQLKGVHISMIDNEMTALHMFESGQLDMLGMPFSPIPLDALPTLSKTRALNTRSLGASTIAFFNVNEFPFNNVHIRKAFALAIDRAALVKNITQLNETIATEMIPPVLKNHQSVSFFNDADFSEAKKELQKGLDELKISADTLSTIVFSYSNGEFYHKLAQALQQQWLEVLGINVRLESQDLKILLDKMSKRKHSIALLFWAAQYDDPMNIFERFKSKANVKNYPGWENTEYQKLLDKSAYDQTPEKRLETLTQAEEVLLNEMPFIPLYHWSFAFLTKPHLKNVHLSSIGDVHIERITFDKDRMPL